MNVDVRVLWDVCNEALAGAVAAVVRIYLYPQSSGFLEFVAVHARRCLFTDRKV